MFPSVAIVKHVQMDNDNNRFYAQAEVTLAEDVDQAELRLADVDSSVHSTPLMDAKAGAHKFDISGDGTPRSKQAKRSGWCASVKANFRIERLLLSSIDLKRQHI